MKYEVRQGQDATIQFEGQCLADVVAWNHDDTVRRRFRLYRRSISCDYVAERIDDPDTIDVRYWGSVCQDVNDVYQFFGNEPLANYLYGLMRFTIPGISCSMHQSETNAIAD